MLALVIPSESEARELVLRSERLTLGRSSDNDIVISDTGVSRRHALIRREGFRWFIDDLGSAHGVFVNDAKVQSHLLVPGDRVRIGQYAHVLAVVEYADQTSLYADLQHATDEQRLVHADELETRGELDFANWVRAEVALHRLAPLTAEHAHQQQELWELSKRVPPQQRALMARAPIDFCGRPGCPRDWSKLEVGHSPRVRRCRVCRSEVTYCSTIAEAREEYGTALVIDPGQPRVPGDIGPPLRLMPVG